MEWFLKISVEKSLCDCFDLVYSYPPREVYEAAWLGQASPQFKGKPKTPLKSVTPTNATVLAKIQPSASAPHRDFVNPLPKQMYVRRETLLHRRLEEKVSP